MRDPKQFLTDLFYTAVATADPDKILPQYLPAPPRGRLIIIGAGKASAAMARCVANHYPTGAIARGVIITRYGHDCPCPHPKINILTAAHPIPDENGLSASGKLLDCVADLSPDDMVIALISGGGSALLCAPIAGITLQDKINLNTALIKSGATIAEINLVRKHISRTKGGQLAAACYPARVVSLLISDVAGDNPRDIASGVTMGEDSLPRDALAVLDKWQIATPAHVRVAIMQNSGVVKSSDSRLAKCEHYIVATAQTSLNAASQTAQLAGAEPQIIGDALEGIARDLGAKQAKMARQIQDKMQAGDAPIVMLSGGECSVIRTGTGIGGPNAEFVLSAVLALNGRAGISVLACDTDGVDGAAEVAGAFGDADTLARAKSAGICPNTALQNNDSHRFFAAIGGQIITGATLTNVNDFRAFLITKD